MESDKFEFKSYSDYNGSIKFDSNDFDSKYLTTAIPNNIKPITISNGLELLIFPQTEELYKLYESHVKQHKDDCGFDLYIPETQTIAQGETVLIDLQIKAVMMYYGRPISYDLRARSSIYKTPLRLANSVGTIDAGYRDNLKIVLDHIKYWDGEPFKLIGGTRLVQIYAPTLQFGSVQLVNSFDMTERGERVFGSTG